jgi:hypothetical protein
MEGESTSTPTVSAETPVMGEAVSAMMSVVTSETVSAVMSPTERAAVTPGMMSPAMSAVIPVPAVMPVSAPVSGMSCPTEFAVMSMTTVMRPTASAPLTAPAMMVMTVVSDPGITAMMAAPVSSMVSSVPVISVMLGPTSLILTSFVILASPFAPAVAVTAIGILMTQPSLFVVAAPAALGSFSSPVLSALGTPLPSTLSAFVIAALGKFVPTDVAIPPTTCSRTIVGLFPICVTLPSARSVVPPIAFFVVPSATIVVSAVAAIVRQFVRSDLVGLRRSPVHMGGELHQSGSCQPSQKHQHVVSHSTIPSPDSRPFDSRGKGNHNRATLTEGEAA